MQTAELKVQYGIELENLRNTLEKALNTDGFTLNGAIFINKPYSKPYMKTNYVKGESISLNPNKRFAFGKELAHKSTTIFQVIYDLIKKIKDDNNNRFETKIYVEENFPENNELIIEIRHWKDINDKFISYLYYTNDFKKTYKFNIGGRVE